MIDIHIQINDPTDHLPRAFSADLESSFVLVDKELPFAKSTFAQETSEYILKEEEYPLDVQKCKVRNANKDCFHVFLDILHNILHTISVQGRSLSHARRVYLWR